MAVYLGSIKKHKWYWVIGKYPNLRVTTNRPKGKLVREPHESMESAEKWIFYQFLMTPATLAGYISEIFKRKRVWK